MFEKTIVHPRGKNLLGLDHSLKFSKGSIHHITPFVIWVLDFCAYLIRTMCIGFETPDGNINQTNFGATWNFILNRSCRAMFSELLKLSKLFLSFLNSQSSDMYIQSIHANILGVSRVNLNIYIEFWENLESVTKTLQGPELDEQESILFTTGKVTELFQFDLVSIRQIFQSYSKKFFRDNSFDKILFESNQSGRIIKCGRIDNLLLQNIRESSSLKKCGRCGMMTQISIELDAHLNVYQSSPPWINTYLDACYCGGLWVPV
jgi:hypothetical protein